MYVNVKNEATYLLNVVLHFVHFNNVSEKKLR